MSPLPRITSPGSAKRPRVSRLLVAKDLSDQGVDRAVDPDDRVGRPPDDGDRQPRACDGYVEARGERLDTQDWTHPSCLALARQIRSGTRSPKPSTGEIQANRGTARQTEPQASRSFQNEEVRQRASAPEASSTSGFTQWRSAKSAVKLMEGLELRAPRRRPACRGLQERILETLGGRAQEEFDGIPVAAFRVIPASSL